MRTPPTSIRLSDAERAVIDQAAALDESNRHDWMRTILVRAARRKVRRAVAEEVSPS